MSECKYGCGEEITWIDGKPYSLQNHMKVCSKGNAGNKKQAVRVGKPSAATATEQANYDSKVDTFFKEQVRRGGLHDERDELLCDTRANCAAV